MKNNDVYEFEAPKGGRMFRYGTGITRHGGSDRWWSYAKKQWLSLAECQATKAMFSSHMPCCRTFRAFKSHIRRHRHELKGCEVIFCSRYLGHNISIKL